ncbi:hypothetical protein QCE47_18690 [Caballeronia sp. LZ025]|uniref:hypothetical protein n=1 Tax=Caballeronia TaxID=1827195 RepID=UPI001FD20D4D|nr:MULTISPECIES: hypothetical protein [Caballeronia]MDR5734336.1 hypothetical protein [Caballeronia sp. LZ025]
MPSSPPGPGNAVHVTESYGRLVALDARFCAWPMVNVYDSRLAAGATCNGTVRKNIAGNFRTPSSTVKESNWLPVPKGAVLADAAQVLAGCHRSDS